MARILIILAMAVILGVPFAARLLAPQDRTPARPSDDALTLIIVTPHIEQIRLEFAAAFDRWHRRVHGRPVFIDWRTPGGTTEIRKQLEAQAMAAIAAGQYEPPGPGPALKAPARGPALPEARLAAGAMEADLFFGGGSYEHTQVKHGIETTVLDGGKPVKVRVRLAAPGNLDEATLRQAYGVDPKVGVEFTYDPDQYWYGAALSGFGIVYNRDLLKDLHLPEPTAFTDLCDPRYIGLIAMADPRQSGSVATLYDSILNREGWEKGWRTLREMSANARAFVAASTQPPMDVGQGDAAAGVAIDFYGRGQAQALVRPGESEGRMGYIDPPGATYVDADPVTILAGAREPELAKRFVEFVISAEGQALWQFPPRSEAAAAGNPEIEDDEKDDQKATRHAQGEKKPRERMGPERYRLRRMPVRPEMYEKYGAWLTDKANPYKFASASPIKGWRDAIGPMMGAFAIDSMQECRAAWRALNRARADAGFPKEVLAEMESAFYALPSQPTFNSAGSVAAHTPITPETFKLVSEMTNRWRDPVAGVRARIAYTKFFKEQYRRVIELGERRESAGR